MASRPKEWAPVVLLVSVALLIAVAPRGLSGATVRAIQQASNLEAENALRDATRAGDLARVRELLEARVNVDAGDRYGSTALFFAADKGHLEIAKLLIEAGARLDATDRFYQMTPLVRALSSDHLDLARLFVEKGSPGSSFALIRAMSRLDHEDEGVRADARAIADAVISADSLSAAELAEVRQAAAKTGDESLVARVADMRGRIAATEANTEADLGRLEAIAGRYQNDALGRTLDVRREDGELVLFGLDGNAESGKRLTPLGDNEYSLANDVRRVWFGGRGGMIERMELRTSDTTVSYRPFDEAESREAAPSSAGDEVATDVDLSAGVEVKRDAPQPWPGFRGKNALGIADGQGVPVQWNASDGEGVLWKTAVEGFSVSSPVIWGDSVFVLSAVSGAGDETFRIGLYGDTRPVNDLSPHIWKMVALHRRTGERLWERVLHEGVPLTKRHTKSSQANATPVTDGRHIVVALGSIGKLVCLSVSGELVWEKDIGVLNSAWFYDPDYQWGHSSSPILYKGMVILQADVHNGSFIAAYRIEDGEEIWKTIREDEISTFSTPSVWHAPEGSSQSDELVTNGTTIRGYDPETGKPLWFLGPNSEIPIGVPLVTDELIYVIAGYPPIRPIYAVRPGHRGDLSLSGKATSNDALAWSKNRGGTYIPSPLVYRGLLYTNANNGRLTCYDAETGERIYRARIGGVGGSYAASPVAADGRLYFTNEEGETFVVRAGRDYELLGKNTVDEIVLSSPAVSDGVFVIRGLNHVFGLGDAVEAEGSP